MLTSALPLALTLLCATPEVPSLPEQRVRTLWLAPEEDIVEVFVRTVPLPQVRWPTSVVLPESAQHVEADPDATAQVDPTDSHRLWVSAGPPRSPGSPTVRVTLASGARLTLRLVARPNVGDVLLTLRRRPSLDAAELARQLGERLARCQTEEERVAGVTRLIAERGSQAVLHREFGAGEPFKQTNGLEITFVDVVHVGDLSYATLKVTNRSDYDWPVNLESISLSSPESGEVRLISRASERTVIPPHKGSRVVLAYETPAVPALVFIMREEGLFVSVVP